MGFSDGIMITASHNPANYNGLKMTRDRAQAISLETGLSAIRDRIASGDFAPPAANLELELEAGDLLYLPRGDIHAAHTSAVHSAHVTIGMTIYT